MKFPHSKTGNGCFWLFKDHKHYLVKVDDGVTLDPSRGSMRFSTARKAYDFCYDQYEQSSGMESHAYWNVCEALQEYVDAEEDHVA